MVDKRRYNGYNLDRKGDEDMTIQEMQERKREGVVRIASWNRAEGAGRDYADAKV